MNKKILEICLSPDLGGLELCALDYFNYFKTRCDTYICVANEKKLDNYFEDKRKFTLRRNKLFPLIPALQLAKFIDDEDIDIIHFHWTRDITTVVLAKVLSKKKPKVLQSRHMSMTRFKNDFYHKWLYRNIDTIHAVTNQVKEQLIKYIPQDVRPNVEMVYLGVKERDVDKKLIEQLKQHYSIQDEFVVGIVGRIEDGKGQYILIDAIKKLQNLKIKALIVGDTMDEEYLDALKNKVKSIGIEEKVIFTGFTKEVDEHICLCDATVLATPKETFGLVVIESMVNKVPVIAVNNGGPLEIIDDGNDGLFFDRSSDELAEKIALLYSDKKKKEELAVAAYAKTRLRFDFNRQNEKLQGLFE